MASEERADPNASIATAIPDLLYNEALGRARSGSLAEARDRLLAVLALTPDMVDAQVVLGKVYAQMGDYARAIDCWERALQIEPGHAGAEAGMVAARALVQDSNRVRRRRTALRYAAYVGLFVLGLLSIPVYLLLSSIGGPSDLQLVQAALDGSPGLARHKLLATAGSAGIEIRGRVDTVEQRLLAGAIAENESRSTPISLAVEVAHPTPRAESFARLLGELGGPALSSVTVEERPGALLLAGEVPTGSEKDRLTRLARTLVGVDEVDTNRVRTQGMAEHAVESGDTLWGLAARFYGSARRWPEIARANPTLAKPYDAIAVGTRLMIPPPRR